MHPDRLLLPSAVATSLQNGSHLLHAGEDVATRQEPPDRLCAWRSGQAALISPVLVEHVHIVECQLKVEVQRFFDLGFVPMNHRRRKLLKEGRVRLAGLDADAQDSRRVAFFVDVYKVKLGSSAVCSNSVVGWGMNMPAYEVDGSVVVSEARVLRIVAFFVRDCERRTEAGVVKVAFIRATVVEGRLVRKCRAMFRRHIDWRLVSARVAHLIV